MKLVAEKENANGLQVMEEEELDSIAGGFSEISDPIYGLEDDEIKVLKSLNYRLDKTKSGNYRVYYSNGCVIEPHVLRNMCNAIHATKKL